MKITKAIDIIKALPLDTEQKTNILARYDMGMSVSEKLVIDELAWKMYDSYLLIKLDENTELAMQEVRAGTRELGDDFNTYVRAKTEDEMEKWLQSSSESTDLSRLREQLGKITNAQ